MKKYSAGIAAALLFFAVLACNLGKNKNTSSNNNANSDTESTTGSDIKEIHMAKDDGSGQPGEETTTFAPGDHTIHCVATLNESKSGTAIKFSWWIVDADGTQDKKIKDIDYTTKTLENVIHGHLTLPQDWPKGKYKVEMYVNGNLEKTVPYSVQ